MLRITALAGLVALGSAKTYVFNAEKCNTNFNNAANWQSFDAKGKAVNPIEPDIGDTKEGVYPDTVQFADASGNGVPVDAFLAAGGYQTRTVKLQRNMKLTFATDGAILNFNNALTGTGAVNFVTGQNSGQAECSLGCHSNFFATTDKPAAALDSAQALRDASGPDGIPDGSSFSALPNTEVPCGDDTIVLPSGYGYNFLALGFHAYKSVVYKTGDAAGSQVVAAASAAELPDFMTWPSLQQKVFVGKDVVDNECSDYGHTAKIGSKKQCVCTTECPSGKTKEADAITQAAVLRAASKAHAQSRLKALMNPKGTGGKFSYTFANAYDEHPRLDCEVDAAGVAAQVNTYFGGAVSTNTPTVTFLPGNRIQVDGQLKNTAKEWEKSFRLAYDKDLLAQDSVVARKYKQCDAESTASLKAMVVDECKPLFDGALDAESGKNFGGLSTCDCLGSAGIKDGLDKFRRISEFVGKEDCRVQDSAHSVNQVVAACYAKGKSTKATTDVRKDSAAALAMKVYAAVITGAGAKGCISENAAAKLVAGAGVVEIGCTSGSGCTTPNPGNVNIFGGANLPQMDVYRYVDSNNKAAVVAHLAEGLKALDTGFSDLVTDKIASNFVITSPNERVAGKPAQTTPEAHVDARYGHATQLIKVSLGYKGWVTASGPQMAPLEAMVNGLLGTLSYDADKGVIKSHHRCFAFDTGYDQACIDAIVQDAIATELEKTECGFGKYDTCEDKATQIAYEAIIDIKQCGILGYAVVKDAQGADVRRCYDTQADQEVKDMAKALSGSIAGSQVASLMTAHSSSMHAYSSSKEAVKSSLRVAWLDHKEERDAQAVKDLDALVKAITLANEKQTAEFAKLGTNPPQGTPKPAKDDSGDGAIKGWNSKAAAHAETLTNDNDEKQAKLQSKQKKYNECNSTSFNTTSFVLEEIEYCNKEWEALEAARGDAYVSQSALATYLAAWVTAVGEYAIADGITQESKLEFNKLNERLKTVVGESKSISAYLEDEINRHSLDSDIAGCDSKSKDTNCLQMAELLAKLAELKKSNEAIIAEQEKVQANGEQSASTAGGPKSDDDGMMMIIIIAAAALVICCLVFAAFMLLVAGGGGGAKGGDDNRNVVAFENPMYDDPNQQQYGAQPGYDQGYDQYGAPPAQAQPAYAAAPPAEDAGAGLYDEPEIAPGAAGGGYLDVEPDDDDDEDEEEDDEDEEEDEDDKDEDEDDEDEDDEDEDDEDEDDEDEDDEDE